MTSEGLADLEADYRKLLSHRFVAFHLRRKFALARRHKAPSCLFWDYQAGFTHLMQRVRRNSLNSENAMQLELDDVYITTVIKTLASGFSFSSSRRCSEGSTMVEPSVALPLSPSHRCVWCQSWCHAYFG